MFLQVPINPESILDRSFGISPDTVLGTFIGSLVALFILTLWVIYKLYSAREKDKEDLKASEEKSREVLSALGNKLSDIHYSNTTLNQNVNDKFQQIKELIKEKV